MLFLISSAPDTQEFKTAYKTAKDMDAKICLVQNAVYASRTFDSSNLYVIRDELKLRGVNENEVSGKLIDYGELVDLMTDSKKVVGFF